MATRANIAIKNNIGSYDCIYTHWDGDAHLPILEKHYNSEEKARKLIEMGNLLVLDKKLHPDPKYYHGQMAGEDQIIPGIHNWYGRQLGVTLFFGEPPERNLAFKECLQNEFLYVWSNGSWNKY